MLDLAPAILLGVIDEQTWALGRGARGDVNLAVQNAAAGLQHWAGRGGVNPPTRLPGSDAQNLCRRPFVVGTAHGVQPAIDGEGHHLPCFAG